MKRSKTPSVTNNSQRRVRRKPMTLQEAKNVMDLLIYIEKVNAKKRSMTKELKNNLTQLKERKLTIQKNALDGLVGKGNALAPRMQQLSDVRQAKAMVREIFVENAKKHGQLREFMETLLRMFKQRGLDASEKKFVRRLAVETIEKLKTHNNPSEKEAYTKILLKLLESE